MNKTDMELVKVGSKIHSAAWDQTYVVSSVSGVKHNEEYSRVEFSFLFDGKTVSRFCCSHCNSDMWKLVKDENEK